MTSKGTCAVTGASGYVGSILVRELSKHMPVVRLVRKPASDLDIGWTFQTSNDVAVTLQSRGVKTLVHAAWDMRATTFDDLHKTCVDGSRTLFDAATRAGVERIVFISTISAFEGCRSAYGKTKLEVEKMLTGKPGAVLRPGLVFGSDSGGVFGGIRKQVHGSRFLPMIGSGETPQYLLDENTLAQTVVSAVAGQFDHLRGRPITLAGLKPWPFRDLVQNIARSEGRDVKLVPVPWQLLFCGIRLGELLKLNLPFRSDSVLSFIYSNRNPDFTLMRSLGINPAPYTPRFA